MIMSKKIQEIVGYSVVFWYLDVDILNKYYCGVLQCLNELKTYPGVSRVDILPIEGCPVPENIDELFTTVIKYSNGV